ncbi:hypothetical protein V1522DRAFT_281237 [Lipomyces starkeyi]
MVGIAGGSRGCANCKARKIKCDEEFPQCHRCVKSGRECGGSIMGPVFRKQRLRGDDGTRYISSVTDSTIIHPSKPRKGRKRMAKSLEVPETSQHLIQVPEMSQTQIPPTRSLKSISSDVMEWPLRSQIPREMVLFPGYDLYHHCVSMFIHSFTSTTEPSRLNDTKLAMWTRTLPQLVLSSSPSSTTFAARSLVLSYCGSMMANIDLILMGTHWYTQALQRQKDLVTRLIEESSSSDNPSPFVTGHTLFSSPSTTAFPLRDPSSGKFCVQNPATNNWDLLPRFSNVHTPVNHNNQEDCVITAMLLSVYEVGLGFRNSTLVGEGTSNQSSWISLIFGWMKLMELRGPYQYREGFNNGVFHTARGVMTFCALLTRKRTFLNRPEWKTIPFEVNGKHIYHKLFDLLLEIPQYDERLEQLFVPCRNRDIGTQQPVLKTEFQQGSVYDELATMDTKLENLTERFEQWFVEYTVNVESFAKQDVSLAVTDSYIRAITSRCPAVADDEEWHSTHFFKPLISYPTSYDARLIGIYYAARMMLIHMLQHTHVFKIMHQHGYRDPSAVLVSPGLEAFLIHTSRNMAELAVLICRSYPLMQSEKYGFGIVNRTLSLRLACRVLRDPLDRGWIWEKLLFIDEHFPSLCFGDDIPNETMQKEWHVYKQQPICSGCGERLRNN